MRPFELDTPPPQDLTAEVNVLGCMMLDPEDCTVGLALLSPTDFYGPGHNAVFDAIKSVTAAGVTADSVTVASQLEKAGKLASLGGRPYLHQLLERIVSAGSIAHHAAIIRECAQRRKLIHQGIELIQQNNDLEGTVEENVCAAVNNLTNILGHSQGPELPAIGEFVDRDFDLIEKRQRGEDLPRRVYFGFHQLDELTGGMVPGEVTIVAARPGQGKTSVALQAAAHAARSGLNVILLSIEMGAEDVRFRLLSQQAHVPYSSIIGKGRLTPDELKRIQAQRDVFRSLSLRIEDPSVLNVPKIRLMVQKASLHKPVDVIIVDYLQLMTPTGRHQSKNYEVAEISADLKRMAKDLDCPVLALCQFNRQTEGRQSQRPRVSDLRDSGALEQDAALVIALHREQDDIGNIADDGYFLVLKNRSGRLGPVSMSFDGPRLSFGENQTYEPDPGF